MSALSSARVDRAILTLAAAYFVQATGALSIIGAMDAIALTWHASRQEVGYLITAFGVPFAVLAPLLQISGVGRWPRRRQLLLGIAGFGVFSAIAALSQTYGQLLIARCGMGVSAALMGPVLGALGSSLVPAEQQGSAIARVLMGLSVASVAGTPLASWVASSLGPRWMFAALAVLAVINGLAVRSLVPSGEPVAGSDWRMLVRFVSRPFPLAALLVATCAAAGVYTFQSFLEPVVKHYQAGHEGSTATALLTLGCAGVMGNAWVGWASRRHSSNRLLTGAFWMLMAILGIIAAAPHVMAGLYLLLALWALATDVIWPTQQRRVVELWPEHRGLGLALTASFMFCGMGLGAAVGGSAYAAFGLAGIAAASAGWLVLALGLVALTSQRAGAARAQMVV